MVCHSFDKKTASCKSFLQLITHTFVQTNFGNSFRFKLRAIKKVPLVNGTFLLVIRALYYSPFSIFALSSASASKSPSVVLAATLLITGASSFLTVFLRGAFFGSSFTSSNVRL